MPPSSVDVETEVGSMELLSDVIEPVFGLPEDEDKAGMDDVMALPSE